MRNCLRVIFVVALVLMSLAGIGGGAVTAAELYSGSILGYVYIDGTATRIDNATVRVYNSDWDYVKMDRTGTGGYSIGGLNTGVYYVMAEADGYYSEYYDNATSRTTAKTVPVVNGTPTKDIDFHLVPGKAITGTVYDNATNPIGHAYVEVVDNGTLTPRGSVYSTDNGSYSITVAPGTYKVRAMANGYDTEYYNNVSGPGSATLVTLPDDADVPGIDFSLGRSESIAGQVFKDDNVTPLVGVTVTAYNTGGQYVSSGKSSSDNGSYFINLLVPGDYRIVATAAGWVPQWWDSHSLASEPSDPLPLWTVGNWVTVTTDNQTVGCNFQMLPKQAVATSGYDNVTTTTAALNGNLTSMGGSTTVNVRFEWGTTTAYGSQTTPQAMSGKGFFTANLTGLTPGATYHFRAVAVGGLTTYGDDITFVATPLGVPAVTTDAESLVSTSSATLNGNLTDLGTSGNVTVSFEYGATTAYGSTTTGELKTATGTFSAAVTSLAPNTLYHFRAVGVGDGGPAYGADRSFTTLGAAPAVTTDNATAVGTSSATLKGALTSLGTEASVVVSFEWRVAGGLWAETTPQTLTAAGAFTANLTNLSAGTVYFFRAKADGYGAPVNGLESNFTTTAIDNDGPVISSLTHSDETSSSAIIKWTTDEAATSQVEYGLTGDYGQETEENTNLVTSHSVELTGLEAGKTYSYRVISKDAAGNETISEGMTLETEGGGGGMPAWGWVLIGLAGVAVVGGGGLLLLKGRAPKPE